ncbi:ATP-binding cassette domain-containing protein [Leucobacter albus]|uniref:ATP-binding cassette domain-containing protein n=1 Tax=Leucobacter albus TaxID=272210 RepID=A0ABW3TSE5_9MICO
MTGRERRQANAATVRLEGVSKRFGLHSVLEGLTLTFDAGEVYCLRAPSGAGKTSLLRMLMGLEHPDAGAVTGAAPGSVSVMFQEDRLSEALTAVENVALVHPDRRVSRRSIRHELATILPERSLDQPVAELSGGMRRRVALVCAMLYPSSLVLLDEPFTGLDAATKREAVGFVHAHRAGRTLIVATHGEEDAALLGARTVRLPVPGGSEVNPQDG